MENDKLLAQFERDGFIVVEDFFDDVVMDRLDGIIRGYYGDNPDFWHNDEFLEKAQTEVVPWFPQNEGVKAFDEIDQDPRLQVLTEAILGDGWGSQYCMVMFSKQGTAGQAWHQDCPPDSPTTFNLNRLVYASDITDEIGGQTVVVPGSYRQGLFACWRPGRRVRGPGCSETEERDTRTFARAHLASRAADHGRLPVFDELPGCAGRPRRTTSRISAYIETCVTSSRRQVSSKSASRAEI